METEYLKDFTEFKMVHISKAILNHIADCPRCKSEIHCASLDKQYERESKRQD